ncbi:MAG: ornithine carbamoyltransferase [Candidatus Wukongarchaeota archaeon]|nr:ornithine carbamoyltransferase [Candidatus Wukongarchaeota archaeon]MDO8128963.1 ornithine carbamoyltransferase [Candidatus Wukongarchaeota archaeon]
MVSLKGKNFLTLQDFSPEELHLLLETAKDFKRKLKRGEPHEILKGKSLAMVFQKPSLRTRVSFEVGMQQLGGHAIYLGPSDIKLGKRETIGDGARTLSRYVDGIMARVFAHSDVEELAEYATVPVINGLSDFLHPCQGLGDLLTVWEKKGKLKGLKLAFIGDGNNVCNSLLFGCSKLGINISVGCPKKYEPPKEIVEKALENAEKSGAKIEVLTSPEDAVREADVIYTDVFVSMGFEKEREERIKLFLPKYQVDKELVTLAKKDYIFMHDLPAHREEEVTSEIIDDPKHSVVWDQAENRLHAQKAILALILQ